MLALVAILAGCSGGKSYQVFHVAGEDPVLDPACYGGTVPNYLASDSDTFEAGLTVALFEDGDDNWYFETGNTAVPGSRDGSSYSFSAEYSDVSPYGNYTVTATTQVDITSEVSGNSISGKFSEEVTSTCEGGRSCPSNFSCTFDQDYSGVRVSDDVPTSGTLGNVYISPYTGYTTGYDTGTYYAY